MTGTSGFTAAFLGLFVWPCVFPAAEKVAAPRSPQKVVAQQGAARADDGAARGKNKRPELEVQVGNPRGTLIEAVAFSPDGRWALSGGGRETAILWDVSQGLQVRRWSTHFDKNRQPFGVSAVAFSPNGQRIVTGSSEGVCLWELATGKLLWRQQVVAPTRVAGFSPDGSRILTGGSRPVVLDAATGKPTLRLKGPALDIKTEAFSPDGKYILTGGRDKAVRLWDAATGKEVRPFLGHARTIISVAFVPGRLHAVSASERTVRVWDLATGKELQKLPLKEEISTVAVSPNGKELLVAESLVASLWSLQTGKKLREFGPHYGLVQALAFSADGERVITGDSDALVRIWDARIGELLHELGGRAQWVWALAFSPNGHQLLFGGTSVSRVWDLRTGREGVSLVGHKNLVYAIACSPDGKRLLTGSADNTARIWDATSGREVRVLKGHTRPIHAVAFSPDGQRALTGGDDGMARLWDVATGREVHRWRILGAWVRSVCFSRDGRRVLIGSTGGARLLNVVTGEEEQRWAEGFAVDLSPDGKLVVAAYLEGISLWAVQSGERIRRLQIGRDPKKHFSLEMVRTVRFSPDGKHVLSASDDRTARLWEVSSGKELLRLDGHRSSVSCAIFSPDGKRLVTAGSDMTERLWDATTGRELCRFVLGQEGVLAISPDGYYLASRGTLGSVAYRSGLRVFPFEQFDLKFNRPDLVLRGIGLASPELLAAYSHACEKRLARMNFSRDRLSDDFHLPEVAVTADARFSTPRKRVRLKIRARDSRYPLDRLLVHVNGSPLHGRAGINLRRPPTQDAVKEVAVELSTGPNKIAVSVLNQKGAESLREVFHLRCRGPAPKPNLYVLAVGVSHYADRRFDLTYADKDAEDLAKHFKSREGKSFGTVVVLPVLNKKATRENILAARKLLEQAGVDDQVVLFFAGHGLLDSKLDYYFATTDIDFKNPAKRGLPYRDIDGLLDGLRARKKLLLVDTCHAGEADKDELKTANTIKVAEGTVRARSFRGLEFLPEERPPAAAAWQLMHEFLADLRRGTGAAVITSSGAAECALESEAWKNGVFTYAVLTGLKDRRAARRKGQPVLVSELRAFVKSEVQRLTRGRQTPADRAENFKLDFEVD